MARQIRIYDTTLRDGTQGEGVSFSMEDKVRLAQRLDALGVHYIEGGWPGSNPKDLRFFRRILDVPLKHARMAAFGATRRPGISAAADPSLQALVEARTPVATIFGKSWPFHVTHALQTTLPENLLMIADSVAFLVQHVEEVVYDAEHYFDGFKKDRELRARDAAGGRARGRQLPRAVRHQRREPAVGGGRDRARDPAARRAPARHPRPQRRRVRGRELAGRDPRGRGARPGDPERLRRALRQREPRVDHPEPHAEARASTSIPELHLRELRDVARFAFELANRTPWQSQPFVGDSAFAHKAGMHVSAILKHPETYEHITPDRVGNHRRVLVSELAGKSNILWKAREYGIDLEKDTPETRRILDTLKRLEDEGYQFEGAEASFELLMERALGNHRAYFELEGYRVIVEARRDDREPLAEATVRVQVKGISEHTAATGNGPVNALDHALRKALEEFYPSLQEMHLVDYKVRILDETSGTAAKTRVLITSADGEETWGTVGVACNIIDASWQALVDSVEYKLRRDERRTLG